MFRRHEILNMIPVIGWLLFVLQISKMFLFYTAYLFRLYIRFINYEGPICKLRDDDNVVQINKFMINCVTLNKIYAENERITAMPSQLRHWTFHRSYSWSHSENKQLSKVNFEKNISQRISTGKKIYIHILVHKLSKIRQTALSIQSGN